MGRGNSSGGGQSSLGYLFGSDTSKPAAPPVAVPTQQAQQPLQNQSQPPAGMSRSALTAPSTNKCEDNGAMADPSVVKLGRNNNNYHRADGQNTGNFITDRPSTKVHSAPGGGSSLGYLFGGKN